MRHPAECGRSLGWDCVKRKWLLDCTVARSGSLIKMEEEPPWRGVELPPPKAAAGAPRRVAGSDHPSEPAGPPRQKGESDLHGAA